MRINRDLEVHVLGCLFNTAVFVHECPSHEILMFRETVEMSVTLQLVIHHITADMSTWCFAGQSLEIKLIPPDRRPLV